MFDNDTSFSHSFGLNFSANGIRGGACESERNVFILLASSLWIAGVRCQDLNLWWLCFFAHWILYFPGLFGHRPFHIVFHVLNF